MELIMLIVVCIAVCILLVAIIQDNIMAGRFRIIHRDGHYIVYRHYESDGVAYSR